MITIEFSRDRLNGKVFDLERIAVSHDLGYTCDVIAEIHVRNFSLRERLANAAKMAVACGVSTELEIVQNTRSRTYVRASEIGLPSADHTPVDEASLKYATREGVQLAYTQTDCWAVRTTIKRLSPSESDRDWLNGELAAAMVHAGIDPVASRAGRILSDEEAEAIAFAAGGGLPGAL